MLTINPSTLLFLPLIIILSIPLLITAAITVPLAAATLCLRVCFVYVDFCVALTKNYIFTFPPSPPASLASAPPSASPRDIQSYGLHSLYRYRYSGPSNNATTTTSQEQDQSRRNSGTEGSLATRRRSSLSTRSSQGDPRAPLISPSAFRTFTTGNLDRDFEGVGGWGDISAAAEHHRRNPLSPTATQVDNPFHAAGGDGVAAEAHEKKSSPTSMRFDIPTTRRRRSSASNARRNSATSRRRTSTS